MRTLHLLAGILAALPFAAGFDCNINVEQPGGQCPDHDAVCPNLACENGFAIDDNGCALCECASEDLDAGPGGDDAGTGIVNCTGDAECGDGERCDTINFCDSPCSGNDGDCFAMCLGRCVDGSTAECFSDIDCDEGMVCVFSGGAAPAPDCDPNAGSCDAPVPAPAGGVCMFINTDPCANAFLDANGMCTDGAGNVFDMSCCQRTSDCFSDGDCPNGFCDLGTSAGGSEGGSGAPCSPETCDPAPPPPPNGICVFPNCDDASTTLCDMVEPVCEPGFTAAVRNGCFECVDARTCTAVTTCDTADCG